MEYARAGQGLCLLLTSSLLSSLVLSDTKVYEPYIRALLGTASHLCEAVVLSCSEISCSEIDRGQERGGVRAGRPGRCLRGGPVLAFGT
jgi:hypothetical protein